MAADAGRQGPVQIGCNGIVSARSRDLIETAEGRRRVRPPQTLPAHGSKRMIYGSHLDWRISGSVSCHLTPLDHRGQDVSGVHMEPRGIFTKLTEPGADGTA